MNASQLRVFLLLTTCAVGCTEPDVSVPIVDAPSTASEESVTWFQSEDMKYGLKDASGREVLAPTYDDVRPFSEGLAAVNLGAEWIFPGVPDGGKWGYVDRLGEVRIPLHYQYANDFSDGLANVANWSSGEGTTFIDPTGKVIVRVPDTNAGSFREGLAPVYRDRSLQGQGWLTEYIDKSGQVVFTVRGYGQEFYDGFAVLSVKDGKANSNENRSYGYIDKKGDIVIQPQFGEALHFSDGLAAVRTEKTTVYGMGDSWGYIDRSGNFVIAPIFNEARPFGEGKAMVHEGGELVLVEDAPCYWEGGSWWLINKSGTKVGRVAE